MTGNPERTVINDRYELQQRIGRGGMADVFLARDLLLDRPVAIKVLFPEFAVDPNFVERFRREAQSAANLNHPNIVGVYDWGKYANTYFMAMEYVQGRTLADILKANGSVTSQQAAEIAGEVAAALGFAHRNGVVHRDIKPANILIGANGQVKVADFGIARAMNAPTESSLTQAGSVMGTATYFSPEQAQGAQPDPRSDLYSLGVVLYEMVSGRPPFSGENPVSIAYKQVHENPQPLNQLVADVPKPFEAIVAKLLAKKPEIRYQTAEAVRDDLRRYRNGEPVSALAAVMGAAAPAAAAAAATTAVPRTATGQTAVQRTTMQPPLPGGRPPQKDKTGMYVVIGFLALIALVGGAILLFNLLSNDTPSELKMPDVVGLPLEEGIKALQDAGLVPNPVQEDNSGVAEGTIGRTDPVKDTVVRKDQTVDVFFTPQKEAFALQDVALKTAAEATALLSQDGLVVDPTPVTEANATVPVGSVIRTDPVAGTQVKQGDTVKLVLSAAPNQVTVPPVEGLSQANAETLLRGEPYNFVVTVTQETSASVAAGSSTRTNPPASQLVDPGTPITLFVSTGPAKVRVPALVGLTQNQATAQLAAAGLVPDISYQSVPFGDASAGRVLGQTPSSGVELDPGSTVKIKIAQALPAPTTTTTPPTTPPTSPPTTTPPPTTPASTAPSTTGP
ncbi:MAG: Stk1 family PASTA domain-containing Ser/Thr kinase [Ilumatobacteraceae bacterium]